MRSDVLMQEVGFFEILNKNVFMDKLGLSFILKNDAGAGTILLQWELQRNP